MTVSCGTKVSGVFSAGRFQGDLVAVLIELFFPECGATEGTIPRCMGWQTLQVQHAVLLLTLIADFLQKLRAEQ